jgi:hypothetical protein
MLTRIAILWIVFAALLGFAAGGSYVSALLIPTSVEQERNTNTETPRASRQTPEERHEANEQAIADYTKWLMFFTAVMSIATVMLGIATAGLYIAGERHSERQLRAYIVATVQVDISNFHLPNPIITLGFVNAGQTPAYNVRVFTSTAVAVFPLENRPATPTGGPREGHSVGVVGPQGNFYMEVDSDIPVTPAERAAVVEGRCALFLYGEIFYLDAFGKERHTSICHFYRGHPARSPRGPLATYHKWNEAT